MEIRWIQPGAVIAPGVEEGIVEIDWLPGIPMDVLFKNPPPTETDEEERKWLVEKSLETSKILVDQPLSRRALFYNTHESELPVNCMSLFHFTIRDNRLNLYVYARSIHMENLGYDLCTIDRVYEVCKDQLPETVDLGKITFRIQSLHYFKK